MTLFTSLLIVVLFGCKTKQLLGGAYDATPTPTPGIHVLVHVQDADNVLNTTPAQYVDVRLYYPNNHSRFKENSTGVSGTAEIDVHEYGTYQIELLPNTYNGYSNSLFDTFYIGENNASKIITRYEPIDFTVTTPTNLNFDQNGSTYTMTFKYNTITPRTITFTVLTNATNEIRYYFESVFSTVNNNDLVTFKAIIPKYYQIVGKQLKFEIKGIDAKGKEFIFKSLILTQTWSFDMTIKNVTTIENCSGTNNIGFKIEKITFAATNLNLPGEKTISFENVEYMMNYNELPLNIIGWFSPAYFGGQRAHAFDPYNNCYLDPVEFPMTILDFTTINFLCFNYNNCYYNKYNHQNHKYVVLNNARGTLVFKWDDFVYKKSFSINTLGM